MTFYLLLLQNQRRRIISIRPTCVDTVAQSSFLHIERNISRSLFDPLQQKNSFAYSSASEQSCSSSSNIQLFSENQRYAFSYNPEELRIDLRAASIWKRSKNEVNHKFCRSVVSNYYQHLLIGDDECIVKKDPKLAEMAILTLLKTRIHPMNLSRHLRELERTLSSHCSNLKMTDDLSYKLLEAHGKAGNIGRCLSLLDFRLYKKYKPREKEFIYAIQSLKSGTLGLRVSSPRKKDCSNHPLEDPTRWLDAILSNMHKRNFDLNVDIVNRMLSCFSSTGRNARGLYWFYETKRNEEGRVRLKMNLPPSSRKTPSCFLKLNTEGTIQVPDEKIKEEQSKDKNLKAAFLFAQSVVTGGVCGHVQPIQLTLHSYNLLLKVCCYRGAFSNAFKILYTTLPELDLEPDIYSYNILLSSLARVGDVTFLRHLLTEMTNTNVPLNAFTVEALSHGYLNAGDIHGAINIIQDVWNQHQVLPRLTTHYKLIEVVLGIGDVYEAKRYVWFLQQIWIWNEQQQSLNNNNNTNKQQDFTNSFNEEQLELSGYSTSIQQASILKKKLFKNELKHLFQYFGYDLKDEEDFRLWNMHCKR